MVLLRPLRFVWLLGALLAASVFWQHPAVAAGENDETVRIIVADSLSVAQESKEYDEARAQLSLAQEACGGGSCSKGVLAELLVAQGIIEASDGNQAAARRTFDDALQSDPNASLPDGYNKGPAKKAFAAAKKNRKKAAAAGCRGNYNGQEPPRGWTSGEAHFCWTQAKRSMGKAPAACVTDARSALELEDRTDIRFTLALCLQKDNRWREAMATYEELGLVATKRRQLRVARQARIQSQRLGRRMPSVTLDPPANATDVKVMLDGDPLSEDELGEELLIDPGPHVVTASGLINGLKMRYERPFKIRPGQELALPILLSVDPPSWASGDELKCMTNAANAEAFRKCITSADESVDLTVRAHSEFAAYTDDMNVDVVSPAIGINIEDVTEGWGVGATFILDVVTAASTDIVATASPRWREARYAPSINGHKRFDDWDIGLRANFSREPDYLATAAGVTAAVDLRQKTVTPSFGYEFSYDIIGRKTTPFSVFSQTVHRHAANLGLGVVLTSATFLSLSGTGVFEFGDTSKPYRYVPVFDPRRVDINTIQPGLNVESVNQLRSPVRMLEALPTLRQRYAVAALLAHRFNGATLRIAERLYADSWSVLATTTDLRFVIDVAKPLRIWPHARFHAQGGASFYQLAYQANIDTATGNPAFSFFRYRTGDRELGPFWAVTGGAGARLDLGSGPDLGLTFSGDVIYTQFLNHLFVLNRFGYFGALAVEATFE